MGLVEQKMGELLKLERERRQLNLEDISSDIKIPMEVLDGIEKGDLSLLPTPVYYGLFARTYSQSLGIDYTRTLEAIKEEVSSSQKRSEPPKAGIKSEESSSAKPAKEPGPRLNTPVKKLVGAAVVVIVVFAAYMAVDTLFFSDGLSRNGASEMLKGVDAERLNALAGFNWEVPGYKPPTELRIELKPKSESWATVMADGDTIIFRRLLPGNGYVAAAKYRLVVSVGVPEAVDIEINGRLVDLRDPANQRISRVEVNQANLQSYLDPSFDDLPTVEIKSPEQGQVELESSSKISASESGNTAPDSMGQTP